MKNIGILLTALFAGAVMASCADFDERDYPVPEPSSITEMNYLKDYLPLKEYLVEGANFRLGMGISADELTAHGIPYRVAIANFNEVVASNDFKYASVVNDEGAIDPSKVTTFVNEARGAGLEVYGHTLVWHAQQNVKWLGSLISPTVIPAPPSEPEWVVVTDMDFEDEDLTNFPHNAGAVVSFVEGADGGHALKITNESVKPNSWDSQAAILFPKAEANVQYKLTMKIRADQAVTSGSQYHGPAFSNYITGGPGVTFTTEWKDYEREFTVPANNDGVVAIAVTFEMGSMATSYYFDDVVIERFYPNGMTSRVEMVEKFVNGKFETDDATNYQTNGAAQLSYVDGGVTGRAVKITNPAVQANGYNAQFILKWTPAMVGGEVYELSFDYKADAIVTAGSQSQRGPGQYLGGGVGNLDYTTEWQHFSRMVTINEMGALALDLGLNATSYYYDNISLKKEETVGDIIVPKTPEEKVEILTTELDRWISAMMVATGADPETGGTTYVKAWDLVNEPMDDDDAFALKTGDKDGNGEPDDPASTNFFWQDYLGRDYVRVAARLARQRGGNDLKLFANDYNLEATYNNNDKARGLIDMVEYWESDGVTKIDGLGTQMHVSYNVDPTRQQAQEAAIVTMYQLLAATGKLVKVSELDMGIVDAEGKDIPTADVTVDQHKAMSAFYKFIVDKYFEIIPAAQQYGITHWALVDQPANSGWRPNTPTGLWDGDNNRKPAYAGFADGLAGN